MNFPKDSAGNWRIQVETEARQVLGILRFQVVDSKTETQTLDKPAKEIPTSTSAPEVKAESREIKSDSSEPRIETKPAEIKEESSVSDSTSNAADSSEPESSAQ